MGGLGIRRVEFGQAGVFRGGFAPMTLAGGGEAAFPEEFEQLDAGPRLGQLPVEQSAHSLIGAQGQSLIQLAEVLLAGAFQFERLAIKPQRLVDMTLVPNNRRQRFQRTVATWGWSVPSRLRHSSSN